MIDINVLVEALRRRGSTVNQAAADALEAKTAHLANAMTGWDDALQSGKAWRDRAERAEAALAEVLSMLDRIEDRQPHDIDGMIFTIPWAQDIVAGSKAIRRVLTEVMEVQP